LGVVVGQLVVRPPLQIPDENADCSIHLLEITLLPAGKLDELGPSPLWREDVPA
jgi:hypothetical protein